MQLTSIRKDIEGGFTLIEFVMALMLLSILTVLSTDTLTNNLNEARYDQTIRKMQMIRKALVGEVFLKQGIHRSDFGYLGDVGGIPTAAQGLAALITNPGVPSAGWAVSSAARIGLGWNGPYFKNDDSGDSISQDAWGSPFVYSPTATPPTVVSLGADRAVGGTGYDQDITMKLPANTLFSTVHGFITQNGAQWSGTAQVELNEPGGAGTLSQLETAVAVSDSGHFSFSNVPMGVRSATVYVPSKAAAIQTIGPVVFTVDKPYYLIKPNLFDLTVTSGPTNLEVPIEMIDYGLSSAVIGLFTTFERSRTPLNTADYDGTVSYYFEIVASNSALLPEIVTLINSSGVAVATLTVPGGTTSLTRFRTAFTPTSGSNDYRIQFPITLLVNQLTMTAGRIIVDQVGATQTNIYVPLIAENTTLTSNLDTVAVDTTTSTTFTQGSPLNYSIWEKEDSNFSLASGTPFRLAVEIAGGTLGTATAALFNRSTGMAVTGASVSSSSGTFSLQQANFSDSAVNFSDLTEYELRISSSNALQSAQISKAGLWIKLSSLGSGEVYYRTSKTYTGTLTPTYLNGQRALINTSVFSNPTVYQEGVASSTSATGTVLSSLDAGVNDSGNTGTAISSLTWGTAKSRQRSSSLSWVSGDRCMSEIQTTPSQTSNVSSGTLIIQFHH